MKQLLIERYLDNDSDFVAVRKEHRPLRQYLSSLQGLRWPDSLQPLLLLSTDPITRRFGANHVAIYDALVSGDTNGVLEGLGRHVDTSQLKDEDSRLLLDMIDSLQQNETETIRVNSSRVIAQLVDRFPSDSVTRLLSPLCRQLDDSPDLRSQLGTNKIAKLLSSAHPEDQRAVASRLVEDVLTIDEEMRMRLETMETPNLDEGIEITKDVVTMVLPIREKYQLDSRADDQFSDWLIERNVKVGEAHYQLPFQDLENWLDEHENHLLPKLRERYTTILADELDKEKQPSFNVSRSLSRAEKVFGLLLSEGERSTLWQQLTRYVALVHPAAAISAGKLMVQSVATPDSSQISDFVIALVDRLDIEADLEEIGPEFDELSQILRTIVSERRADLNEHALKKLAASANVWSKDDYTASFSCAVVNELLAVNSGEALPIMADWAQRILDDLPLECNHLLASRFLTLDESLRSTLENSLNFVVVNDNIDEETSDKFKSFVENVSQDAWSKEPLDSYLDKLVAQVSTRHSNPHEYLFRVFPTISGVLVHASPDTLGKMLHSLFSNTKGQPHYPFLHECMITNWPKPSSELTSYNPTQIFEDAVNRVKTQPTTSAKGLLNSLVDMLTRYIVPWEYSDQLVQAACIVWSTNPADAVTVFASGFNSLSAEQAANLVDPIDWNREDQQVMISKVWNVVAKSIDLEDCMATTSRILDKGPAGSPDEPDKGLRIWLDIVANNNPDAFKALILEKDLNDAHRKRLWSYAIQSSELLGSSFFVETIPEIVQLSAVEQTTNAIFDAYDEVVSVLDTKQNRAYLAQQLMLAFPNAGTKTIKAKIGEWCKRLSGVASLSKLESESLTEDDIDILATYFKNANRLTKLSKEVESRN